MLEVNTDGNTVWLNRNQLAQLFDRDIKTIGKHINNALKEELYNDDSTVAKFATVQTEGDRTVTRNIDYYNLDVIISVDYRVKSQRGVEFRKWANKVLKEYIIKGYSVNHKFTTFGIAKSQLLCNCPHLSLRLTVSNKSVKLYAL